MARQTLDSLFLQVPDDLQRTIRQKIRLTLEVEKLCDRLVALNNTMLYRGQFELDIKKFECEAIDIHDKLKKIYHYLGAKRCTHNTLKTGKLWEIGYHIFLRELNIHNIKHYQ